MYIVNLTKWDATRIVGQEKMLADAWIEAVSDDCSHVSWPPIFSTLQLLRNLRNIIADISRGILRPYHLTHSVDEILARFEHKTWLNELFDADVKLLLEKLRWIKDQTSSDDVGQIRSRNEIGSYLNAFISKVDSSNSLENQLSILTDLTEDSSTSFSTLIRAIHEATNDIMHYGHSRAHLIGWMIKLVNSTSSLSYSESFRRARFLVERNLFPYEVLFHVVTPDEVTGSLDIEISSETPNGWNLDDGSPFTSRTNLKVAKVAVQAHDHHRAIRLAQARLTRHLWSPAFGNLKFDRNCSGHCAAKVSGEDYSKEERELRFLRRSRLINANRLNEMQGQACNEHTFSSLQRILFWIEQSNRVEPIISLISNWTALEFLFSVTEKNDLDAVVEHVPSYLVSDIPRSIVLDFWRFLIHSKVELNAGLKGAIDFQMTEDGKKRCNLKKLFDQCLVEDAHSTILTDINDYPILVSKLKHVRKLEPGSSSLRRLLKASQKQLVFDVRTCYRARNTVVHDAADSVAENECMEQRLNWIVTGCVDSVIYHFSKNPNLSLADIHRCKDTSFGKWKKTIFDHTNLCPTQEVLEPTTFFMV